MIQSIEGTKPAVKIPAPSGTWIQITFTLDPEHYKILWERADEAHRTIPAFIRESVINSLSEKKIISRKNELGFKETI